MSMIQTTLPEEGVTDTPSALTRLEELSHANSQPEVYVKKWSRRSRYAFLIFAGIASWTAIFACLVAMFV